MEIFIRILAKGFRVVFHTAPRLIFRKLPQAAPVVAALNLYVFLLTLAMLMLLLVSTMASISVRISTNVFMLDASTGASAGWLEWRFSRGAMLCVVYACALKMLFHLCECIWTITWEVYCSFPTVRRMLRGPLRPPYSPPEKSTSEVSLRRAVAAAAVVADKVAQADSCDEESDESLPRKTSRERLRMVKAPKFEVIRTRSGSKSSDPAARRREKRRRIVLITPLVVLTCTHLVMLVGETVCARKPEVCEGGTGFFQDGTRVSKVARFSLFVTQLQMLTAWTSFFPRWERVFISRSDQSKRCGPARMLALTMQIVLVPSLAQQGVAWVLGQQPCGVVVASWSLWFLMASFVIVQPKNSELSGFAFSDITDDSTWEMFCTLFKYRGLVWGIVFMLREGIATGFASAHKDLIGMSVMYPLLWCLIWIFTFMAVSASRYGPRFWLALIASVPVCAGAAWFICASVGRDNLPALVVLVMFSFLSFSWRVLRAWAYGESDQPSATARPPSVKFAVKHEDNVQSRRLVGGTARVVAALALLFCAILALCVQMSSSQQRSAMTKDVVDWRHLPDGSGIEVLTNGVRTLRLSHGNGTASSDEAADPRFAVLGRDERPRYAACSYKWAGLDMKDYMMLSKIAYLSPEEVTDLPGLLRELLPGRRAHIVHTSAGHRKWLELEIESCAWSRRAQREVCQTATVVAVSGTDPSRVQDILENIRMWTEPVMMEIFSVVFPIVRMWPRDTTAMLIGGVHRVIRWLDLQDDQWQYKEILDHVRKMPANKEVVLTGHSLGGGIALVVGALSGQQAVALQPPGLYHAFAKHQEQHSAAGPGGAGHAGRPVRELHQSSVSLVVESDLVSNFDGHGGLVQNILCDRTISGGALGCHQLESTICHWLRHCGDNEDHFTSCRHKFGDELPTAQDVVEVPFGEGLMLTIARLSLPGSPASPYMALALVITVGTTFACNLKRRL